VIYLFIEFKKFYSLDKIIINKFKFNFFKGIQINKIENFQISSKV